MKKIALTEVEKNCIGQSVHALCTRMGSKNPEASLYCVSRYTVTPRRTMQYEEEILHCLGNKYSWERFNAIFPEGSYLVGRPSYGDAINFLSAK